MINRDIRIASAIATRSELASLVDVQPATISRWTDRRTGKSPLVHSVPSKYGRLTVPLVAIAEASALHALRSGGMSMQQARMAADFIRDAHGDEFALANPRLVTDGTHAFIADERGLTRLKDQQAAFAEVLRDHLRPLILGADGFVEAFRVERFKNSDVTIDPRYNAGQMSFTRNRIPVFAVVQGLRNGDKVRATAEDFDLTVEEVEDIERNIQWLANFA